MCISAGDLVKDDIVEWIDYHRLMCFPLYYIMLIKSSGSDEDEASSQSDAVPA